MSEKKLYRLSKGQKQLIAQNLIDILQTNAQVTDLTNDFIFKWIKTGPKGKSKAFFDVWEIVLDNYLPSTRPVLFRSCDRISKRERIASFSSSFEFIRKYSKGSGSLIICDTKDMLAFEESFCKLGEYKHTFYPLVDVFRKAKVVGLTCLSENSLNEYLGEEEYIMRINWSHMYGFRWV